MAEILSNNILILTNIILIIANSIFIYVTILRWFKDNRGVLQLKFIGYDKHLEKKFDQKEVEKNPFYFHVKNLSDNLMYEIKLNIVFKFNKKIIYEDNQYLSYLNPHETSVFNIVSTKFLERMKKYTEYVDIKDHHNELFAQVLTPKKSMKFEILFNITGSNFLKYKDRFVVNWNKYDSEKNYNTYVDNAFTSLNIRDDATIMK